MDKSKFKIVTIDGPAASGKSSIARALGESIGLSVINSGSLYRSVAWLAIQKKIDVENENSVNQMLEKNSFKCDFKNRVMRIYINDKLISLNLNTAEINDVVSKIATYNLVRSRMNNLQIDCSKLCDVVCEGRDAGTVVFPNADFKYYIDAKPEVRMKRRIDQGLEDDLEKRDFIDSNRINSPLKPSEDAVVIDNSYLNLDEVVSIIVNDINRK